MPDLVFDPMGVCKDPYTICVRFRASRTNIAKKKRSNVGCADSAVVVKVFIEVVVVFTFLGTHAVKGTTKVKTTTNWDAEKERAAEAAPYPTPASRLVGPLPELRPREIAEHSEP